MDYFKHLIKVATLTILVIVASCTTANALGTDDYDPFIQNASDRWLPGSDWMRYKSQLYQESRLDPDAVSPVGARGIAQFMPGTWSDVAPLLGYSGLSPHIAEPAIEAGAYYLADQIMFWTEPRPYIEQRRLGEASYNAGAGNILKAQRECRQGSGLCGGACRDWYEIHIFLDRVTGRHALETIDYIEKIEHWLMMMKVTR